MHRANPVRCEHAAHMHTLRAARSIRSSPTSAGAATRAKQAREQERQQLRTRPARLPYTNSRPASAARSERGDAPVLDVNDILPSMALNHSSFSSRNAS